MKIFILLTILFSPFQSLAAIGDGKDQPKAPRTVTVISIESVYDGDTFRAMLPDHTKSQRVRVRGIDTAEIKGQCQYEKDLAIKARDYARSLLFNADKVVLANVGEDYYKRVLAIVYVDGQNLADLLIAKGLGRKWKGKRENWCN